MSEIILVRHGQANSAAQDEESYDRLSPLGHQQAAWLGHYMTDHHMHFDHVVTGAARRHRETHASMGLSDAGADSSWNEMEYFTLADAMLDHSGMPVPTSPSDFSTHVAPTLEAWRDGHLSTAPESWAAFQGRILTAFDTMSRRDERVLVVTSGGVISVVLAQMLGLSIPAMAEMLLQIRNSSFHVFQRYDGALRLHQFNATPHLAHPDRAHARTFV